MSERKAYKGLGVRGGGNTGNERLSAEQRKERDRRAWRVIVDS